VVNTNFHITGCMIVELQDYRPKNPKDPQLDTPQQSRTVLHPTPEALWTDLCIMNEKLGKRLTDMEALRVEADILVFLFQINPFLTANIWFRSLLLLHPFASTQTHI
jgi:hypothetical protein